MILQDCLLHVRAAFFMPCWCYPEGNREQGTFVVADKGKCFLELSFLASDPC